MGQRLLRRRATRAVVRVGSPREALPFQELQTDPVSAPPLWVVRREDARVFLFGQGPWGVREDDPWFPPLAAESLYGSGEYWHEVPNDPRLTDGELLARFGLSARPLSGLLAQNDHAALRRAAETVGIDVDSLDGCRPWLAAQLLDLALRGLAQGEIVDVEGVLTEQAKLRGIRVNSEFNDAEEVLSAFADLGDAEIEYLLWTSDRAMRGPAEMRRQAEAWLVGDLQIFEEDLRGVRRRWPHLYGRLLRDRNDLWISRVESLLNTSAASFIVMGMSHLVGDEGVVALVRQRGHSVERAL
jgi:uncharacterized protein